MNEMRAHLDELNDDNWELIRLFRLDLLIVGAMRREVVRGAGHQVHALARFCKAT
jgi:hypothetical protein